MIFLIQNQHLGLLNTPPQSGAVPRLTPQRDSPCRASGRTHVSAESVIRHNFIAVTYIACGLSHMVILLCSISACLFFVFPHPLHLLLAAFPAPFLQRGSYINRSL